MGSRRSNPSVKPGQKNPIDSNTIRSSSLRDYTASDEALNALVEPAHYEVGGFERWKAHADCDIKAFGDYIDPAISAFQMHFNRRVHNHELGNQCAKLEIEQSYGAAHPHHSARLGADLGDHLLGGFCFDQRGEAAVVELAADLRHREAAAAKPP